MSRSLGRLRPVARSLQSRNCRIPIQQIRQLSLHEYQSQDLLREYEVPVARGLVARTPQEVREAMQEIGGPCVLKAQITRGSRSDATFENGLASGIQFVDTPDQGQAMATNMLGHTLRTSSGHSVPVNELFVAEAIPADIKWYLAITIDREAFCPTVVVSRRGGEDIETLARDHANRVFSFPFNLSEGISPGLTARISDTLQMEPQQTQDMERILRGLYRIFREKDATTLEVNPLAISSTTGELTCLDAKFTFDDSAADRQPDLFSLRDKTQEINEEVAAEKHGLVYVRMDGDIGNVVNGAGLAMATNDAIGAHGGRSANFLDAGGKATKETMIEAFRIILSDERVKTILVNIYGGLTRCDMIAESIIGAAEELGPLKIPVVVRLQGTNSPEGLKLLEEADLGLHVEADFGEAARMAVELAKKSQ